ncbi:hypothetical protein QBC47DRAFT_124336 [Echria macrotheca]|uniref:Glycosyltransferase family 34 protein n=1 Tax=Echria macrotheca TaxID=438768 RepID=A0AAJ0F6N6_9PEZI|nr:hypothetical protein QBC47DRAFT_124336 [Echria macrotheca]
MTASIFRTKPARVATAIAVLCLVWIWLSNIQGVRLTDDVVPVSYSSDDNNETRSAVRSRIGKVTVAANQLDSDTIDRALRTHQRHNARHGYTHFIAKNQAVGSMIENDRHNRPEGAWTKPAYLLSVLVAELEKPEEERLEWVFWFDADTIIMNLETPLEVFLPPHKLAGLDNVDLLMATNWDGLNSGVFALRVSGWSVSLISAVLSYPIYQAARLETDRFRDQSAFQFLLQHPESPLADLPMRGADHWVDVPMRWFNSLPVNNAFYGNGTWIFGQEMTPALFDKGTKELANDGNGPFVNPWKIMQGDLAVHFAGTSYVRDSWMGPWLNRAEALLPQWNNATTKEVLKQETAEFWNRINDQMVVDRQKAEIEEEQKARAKDEGKKQAERARLLREKKEKEALAKQRLEMERKVEEKDKKQVGGVAPPVIASANTTRHDDTKKAVPPPSPSVGLSFGNPTPPQNSTVLHSNGTRS